MIKDRQSYHVDKFLLWVIGILLVIGIVMFLSGALSLLANDSQHFIRTLLGHLGLGLGGGIVAWLVITRIELETLAKYSPYLFFGTLILTAAVFIPGIGIERGGAVRWLSIGGFSLQPSEFLKISATLYVAYLLSRSEHLVDNMWGGLFPAVGVIAIVGGLLLAQPDTDTFLVIVSGVAAIMLLAGLPLKQLAAVALVGIVVLTGVVFVRPYLRERLMTFVDPSRDPLGSSYQVQQSILAVGSGEVFGRGIGKSVQKFGYLPQPMGDSIFAVIGEELGFFGTIIIVILYFLLLLRCYQIALKSTNTFARFLVAGIATLFTVQILLNIVSNLGLFPFSGLPLVFMSQGGTALLVALIGYALVARASMELPPLERRITKR
jgi:cell division protein FtsW